MDTDGCRVALVSGGSRGIGRASALRLAEDGFDLSICYRTDEAAALDVTRQAEKLGVRAVATQVDVADPDAVRGWVSATERDLGPVELAVTCAGIVRDGPLVMMSDDNWRHVVDTNLTGVFHVCRAAVFPMMKRRRGSIVTMSSVSGLYGNATQTNYAATKAGIIGFAKSLAKEVGRYGIRVNTVVPGMIETDLTDALTPQARERLLAAIPLGRFGDPAEVADLVSYLAAPRAAYVTGSVLEIHGGITI